MLRYTSTLKAEYSEDLEQLLFFNPGQQTVLTAIMESLEKFGTPSVFVADGCLRIKVEKLDEVQALFALDDDILVGVMVYSRIPVDRLSVIHIAVDHDYSSNGKHANKMLMMRMLTLLRSSARRIKGVKTIRIIGDNNRILDYPVD